MVTVLRWPALGGFIWRGPTWRGLGSMVACGLALGGCAETQLATHAAKKTAREIYGTQDDGRPVQQASVPASPRVPGRPVYKIGDPYQIEGVWYYPKEEFNYVETGIASWYGADFHGKYTANGDLYNMNDVTAAHRTLQLPAVVRVTNLENGRSLVVRINDRGPFARGRIIDLSKRSAELLGVWAQGTAKVKVETLPEESRVVRGQPTDMFQLASVTQQPVATPKPPEPQVRVVPVGTSNIFIQAGAFASMENAKRVQDALTDLGGTAITPVSTTGQRLFRVRLGPVASVEEADIALERVTKRGYAGARIVVE